MRIACRGGGPAGLFFGILAALGGHDVTVHERLPEGVTHGWGVVFWDDLLGELGRRDVPTERAIREHAFRWQDQVVDVEGREPAHIRSHGYSMGRSRMLALLAQRARDVGVDLRYGEEAPDVEQSGRADLVIACDGVGSGLRTRAADAFGTTLTRRRNKYIWLGTSRVFDSFTFPFARTRAGWVWAHAYGFDSSGSTFVVETSPETWAGLGFDRLPTEAAMRRLEEIFGALLDGHPLRPQPGTGEVAPWREFQVVTNARWHSGRVALMGDAAHTTHFTIGSGTRLALEDAMVLAGALAGHDDLDRALEAYGRRRRAALRRTQRRANASASWFEQLPRYIEHERFADMLPLRSTLLQSHLPPGLFLRLADAARSAPSVTGPARRVVHQVTRRPV